MRTENAETVCASGDGCTDTVRYHEGPCVPAVPPVYNEIDDSLGVLEAWIAAEGRACYADYPRRVRHGVHELRDRIARLVKEKELRPVWRCYHCATTFRAKDLRAAREHFGLNDQAMPKCAADFGARVAGYVLNRLAHSNPPQNEVEIVTTDGELRRLIADAVSCEANSREPA